MNKTEIKELEEKERVEKFFKTKVGQEWYEELGIVDYAKSEAPDFKIKTINGDTIALEITKFIAENKNLKFSQALTRIGNKICRESEKEYNLHIHILIDKYDDREFSIHWKDHLDYAYNPGFSKLPDTKKLKQKLQDVLKNNIEKLRKGLLVQEWIQVDDEHFKISMDPIACPWTGKYDCHVNNAGIKQNLKIKKFLGKSENAIKTQICIALISFVLIRMAEELKEICTKISPKNLLKIIGNSLFNCLKVRKYGRCRYKNPNQLQFEWIMQC